MKFLLLLAGLLCFTMAATAQYDPSRISKKAQETYESALSEIDNDDLANAEKLLLDAIRREPGYLEAHVSLAGLYSQLKDRRKSIEFYERAFAIDSLYLTDIRLT
jgi:Tfp pilus assembly protein PilF